MIKRFIYFFLLQTYKKMRNTFSVPVTKAQPGEGPIHRSILSPKKLMTQPAKGVETLYDVLEYASQSFKDRKGFGYRQLQDTLTETKQVKKVVDGQEKIETKTWTYFQLSEYHHYSYAEASDITKQVGAGLRQLGLKKGDKLQISASTR